MPVNMTAPGGSGAIVLENPKRWRVVDVVLHRERDEATVEIEFWTGAPGNPGSLQYVTVHLLVKDGPLSSTRILRNPSPRTILDGVSTDQVVIANAFTNLINAFYSVEPGENNKRKAALRAVEAQLMTDGLVDASLAGTVT